MHPRHSAVSLPHFARVLTVAAIAVGFAFVVSAGPAAVQEQDAELLERGRTVYTAQCASCHGQQGKGDGSAARFLDPKPRDFTAAEWEHAAEGTVEAIAAVVTNGVDDTASVFAGIPVKSVWTWNPDFSSVQFLINAGDLQQSPEWLAARQKSGGALGDTFPRMSHDEGSPGIYKKLFQF